MPTQVTPKLSGHEASSCIPLWVAIAGLIVALLLILAVAALAATACALYRRKRAHYNALLELYRYVNERFTQLRLDQSQFSAAATAPISSASELQNQQQSVLTPYGNEYEAQLAVESNRLLRPDAHLQPERPPQQLQQTRRSPVRFARDSRTMSVDNSGFDSYDEPLSLNSERSQEDPYSVSGGTESSGERGSGGVANAAQRSVSHDPTYAEVDVELESIQIATELAAIDEERSNQSSRVQYPNVELTVLQRY